MSFYYVIVIANHHWLDVWFCCSCCYSPVSLVLLWWLSTWEWTRSIKLHLTIVVKLQVARYPIIGPMAQSSTGGKAFEVEDDADVEIAGCSGCAEPLRWRAGTEFMNESACLKSACDTRSVSSNMLSLSQCIVLLWHSHQQMVGAILVSSWSPSHLLRTLEPEVGHSWKHRSQRGWMREVQTKSIYCVVSRACWKLRSRFLHDMWSCMLKNQSKKTLER